jgi:hypothetical protein
MGTFDSVLNMKYLIQAVKFQWPLNYYFGPLISVILLWLLRNLMWPAGGHMTHFENHKFKGQQR